MIKGGFTLIELLLVIAIIVLLTGAVIQISNPLGLFATARNGERTAHINTMLNAVDQRLADNKGIWNVTCGAKTVFLPTSTKNIGTSTGLVNLESCLVPAYLPQMVFDPSGGNASNTLYQIIQNTTTSRITLSAPNAELGKTISVTR